MTAVWPLPLPHADKLVLLALADNANDEGLCWPSVGTLMEKCGMDDRTVQRAVGRLVEAGHLSVTVRPSRSNYYTVHPVTVTPRHGDTPSESRSGPATGEPRHSAAPSPSHRRGDPVTVPPRTIIEPPKEPSGNRQGRKTAQRLPDGFELTEERRAVAKEERVDAEREFVRFRDHWRAAAGANARKHDWDAAWRNWCRKAADMGSVRKRQLANPTEEERMRQLMDRRAALGLSDFRDPNAGETAEQYYRAQESEWNSRQPRDIARSPAATLASTLAAAKRLS